MLVVFKVRVVTGVMVLSGPGLLPRAMSGSITRSMLMSVAPDAMEAMVMAGVRASTYGDVGMQWPRCPWPNSSLGLG